MTNDQFCHCVREVSIGTVLNKILTRVLFSLNFAVGVGPRKLSANFTARVKILIQRK